MQNKPIKTRRKLQRIGRSSYAITLPKDWVEKNLLKRGEQVEFFVTPESISISPGKMQIKKIEIDVDNYSNDDIKRLIVAYYLSGYTEMSFVTKERFFPQDKAEAIEDIRKRLPALDSIASESVANIQLRTSEFPLTFFENFSKIRDQVKIMFKTIQLMPEIKDASRRKIVQAIDRLEYGVDSHYFVTKRFLQLISSDISFASAHDIDPRTVIFYNTIIDALESSADLLQQICHKTYIILNAKNADKEAFSNLRKIFSIMKEMLNHYEGLFGAFTSKDFKSISEFANICQYRWKPKIDELLTTFSETLPSFVLSYLRAISSDLRWLNRCMWTVSEAMIDIIILERKVE